MFSSIHPIVLIALFGVVIALILLITTCCIRKRFAKIVLILFAVIFALPGFYVFLAFHPEWIDDRFRTYKAFYTDIQVGMTREQVFSEIERHYPVGGARQRPKVLDDTPGDLNFFMNPETSREPNCEGIFLTLQNGHVMKKEYSRD